MNNAHVDAPQGDAARVEKRTPRSIRFNDLEWERIEAFAEQRGVTAAEFVRFAALAVIEAGAGAGDGRLAPLIERTFRYAYIMATNMRAEMLAAGRSEDLESLIREAREVQEQAVSVDRERAGAGV